MIAFFVIRNLLARLDPDAQQKEEAKRKASAANRKLGAILSNKARDGYDSDSEDGYDSRRRSSRPRIEDLNLSAYEQTIAMEVVAPEEIPVSFDGMSLPALVGSQTSASIPSIYPYIYIYIHTY